MKPTWIPAEHGTRRPDRPQSTHWDDRKDLIEAIFVIEISPLFRAHCSELEDPRIELNKLHPMLNILAIAIWVVIGGAENWMEVALYGELKKAWFVQYLHLTNGISSYDTFGRIF